MRCARPIPFETLVAYWMAELGENDEATLEHHLFGCAHCSKRFEGLVTLAAAVRAVVKDGKVGMVVTASFVEAMKGSGLTLREYRLDPDSSVNCTITDDDDAVVSRLRAPLAGVKRLDVVRMRGETEVRLTDVPFDAQAGEVVWVPSAAWLKTMPAFTIRMRLIAVGDDGEKPVGDYTFNHAPS